MERLEQYLADKVPVRVRQQDQHGFVAWSVVAEDPGQPEFWLETRATLQAALTFARANGLQVLSVRNLDGEDVEF